MLRTPPGDEWLATHITAEVPPHLPGPHLDRDEVGDVPGPASPGLFSWVTRTAAGRKGPGHDCGNGRLKGSLDARRTTTEVSTPAPSGAHPPKRRTKSGVVVCRPPHTPETRRGGPRSLIRPQSNTSRGLRDSPFAPKMTKQKNLRTEDDPRRGRQGISDSEL